MSSLLQIHSSAWEYADAHPLLQEVEQTAATKLAFQKKRLGILYTKVVFTKEAAVLYAR
jgi:hypothetical protein